MPDGDRKFCQVVHAPPGIVTSTGQGVQVTENHGREELEWTRAM